MMKHPILPFPPLFDCADNPPPAELYIALMVKQIHHRMQQVIDRAMREAGVDLPLPYMSVLCHLGKQDGLSGAQLAREAMITAQSMNTVLRKLEADGSVTRSVHPENKRTDCWHITEKGKTRFWQGREIADPIFQQMGSPLQAEELTQLLDYLSRCLGALDAIDKQDMPCSRPYLDALLAADEDASN